MALADPRAVQHNLAYGNDPRQTLDLYLPDSEAIRGTVIFFYGGMWLGGHKSDYEFMGQTLANRGYAVIIPDYRLYPKAQYPAFFEDAAAVVRWDQDHASQFGIPLSGLFLMGYSSGSYMAAGLAFDPSYLNSVGLKTNIISGVIGLAGFYNIVPAQRPEIGPVFASVRDPATLNIMAVVNSGDPPVLLLAGRKNDDADFAEASTFATHFEAMGGHARIIAYDELGHIGVMLPFSPLFHDKSSVVEDIVDFMSGKTR